MQKFYGDSTHWGIGVVEDIQDPLNQGRVRVRIHGLHTFDNNTLAIHELPWSHVAIAANNAGTSGVGQTPTGLVEGSFVFGVFLDGEDKQDFLVINALTGTDTATVRQGQILNQITESLYGDSNPERMYSYFRDILGFTEEEAAGALGAVAQFMGSYTLDSVDIDHASGRYGIGNWDEDNAAALRSYASVSSRRYEDFDTQILFLGSTLQHTDAWPNHSVSGRQLGAFDSSEAADSFAVNVLGLPLEQDRNIRHNYARQALDAYGSSTNGDIGLYPERGAPTDLKTDDILPSEEHVYRYIRSLNRNIAEVIVTDTNTQPGSPLPDDWADDTHFLIAEDGSIRIGTLANQPVENMPAGTSVTADGEMLPASRFTTSTEMREQMKRWEGLRLEPYVDAYGYSIGYGYFIGTNDQPELFEEFSQRWMGFATSDRSQISITEAQADQLFDEHVERFEGVVHRSVTVDITQSQFDALVALSYNLGNLTSSASTLIRNLNSGNYEAAASSFTLYTSYRNANNERIRYPQDGVTRALHGRRLVEAEYFRRGNVGVSGQTLRNHRQFSVVVAFQGGQRHGGGRATSYSVEQFNALRVIVNAITHAYPAVSVIGLRDLDDTSNRPLFDVRQFFESTTPETTSNPQPAPATVPDTSGVNASAVSAGGDKARPANSKANAKAVNQSKSSPGREPDVPTPNSANIPSVTDLDSDVVETATGEVADLSAPKPPVTIPSPFSDPILGIVGTASGLGLATAALGGDSLSESEVQALIDGALVAYYTSSQVDTLFTGYYTSSQVDTLLASRDELGELTDVEIASPTNGQVLTYSSGTWVNANVGTGSGFDADLLDGQDGTYYLAWANLTGVPSTFAPSAHTHVLAEITDLSSTTDLPEGTNLYYTTARVNTDIDARVTKSFVDALNVDADTLDGIDSISFVRGDGVDNGRVNIIVDDDDFILADSTDSPTSYLWRDHSADRLYLGTSAAEVTLRSDLNMNGKNIDLPDGSSIQFDDRVASDPGSDNLMSLGGTAILRQVSDRGALNFSSRDDSLILGSGDVGNDFHNYISNETGENTWVVADSDVYIVTDLQNGYDSTNRQFTFSNDGELYVGTDQVYHTGNDSQIAFLNAAAQTFTGNMVVSGDLTVNGTTTYVNTTDLQVGDNIITLNADETGSPTQNAGIEVERGTSDNVQFRWNETTDTWQATSDGSNYYDVLFDDGTAAGDAATLGGLDSTSFMRSDANDQFRQGSGPYISVTSSNVTYPPYFGFHSADDTRRGYIGWEASGNNIIRGENGYGWVFNGTEEVVFTNDLGVSIGSAVTADSLGVALFVNGGTGLDHVVEISRGDDGDHLELDGAGYSTFIGQDSSRTYIRNDSSSRAMAIGVNNINNFEVVAGGDSFVFRDNSETTFFQIENSGAAEKVVFSGTSVQSQVLHQTTTANSSVSQSLVDNSGSPYFHTSPGTAVTTQYTDFDNHYFRNNSGINSVQIESTGNTTFGPTTGATNNPNTKIISSGDTQAQIQFRAGSTVNSKIASTVSSGSMFFDASGGFTWRDGPDGSTVATLNASGNMTIHGTLDIIGQRLLMDQHAGAGILIQPPTTNGSTHFEIQDPDNTNDRYIMKLWGDYDNNQHKAMFVSSSGRVGICDDVDSSYVLNVGGDTQIGGAINVTGEGSQFENSYASGASVTVTDITTAGSTAADAHIVQRGGFGAASTPHYTFWSDGDTGWYLKAANTQAWSTNGTERMVLGNNGLALESGVTVNSILDEDAMSSDSATALATQQSIKAYVDSVVSGSTDASTIDGLNSTQFLRSDTSDTMTGALTVNSTTPTAGFFENTSGNTLIESRGGSGYGGFYARGSGTEWAYLFLGNETTGEIGRLVATNSGNMLIDTTAGDILIRPNGVEGVSFSDPTGSDTLMTLKGDGSTSGVYHGFTSGDYYIVNQDNEKIVFGTNDTIRGEIEAGGALKWDGSGSIGGSTWENGWVKIGTASLGWSFDSNEMYNAGAGTIGTLSGDLNLNAADTLNINSDVEFDSNYNIGVGVGINANRSINLVRTSSSDTDADEYGIFSRINVASGSALMTSAQDRAAIYGRADLNDSSTTADSNVPIMTGVDGYAQIISGHADFMYGVNGLATVSGGSDSVGSTVFGGRFESRMDNAGSELDTAYGVMGVVRLTADADQAMSSAYGVRSFLDQDSTSGATISNAYLLRADVDINASTGTITNLYGLHINLRDNMDGDVTNALGIWVEAGDTESDVHNHIQGSTVFGRNSSSFGTTSYTVHIDDNKSSGAGLYVTGGGSDGPIARFERDVGSTGIINIGCEAGDPTVGFDVGSTGTDDWAVGASDSSTFVINDSADLTTDPLLSLTSSSFTFDGNTLWHAGNDGSGSGLDADLLDGLHASQFLRSDADDTTTGSISSSSYIEAGNGSGGVALTVNDGYGNANLTFNHRDGTPDATGSSARIESTVDSSTARIVFELGDSTTSGVATALTNVFSLKTSEVASYADFNMSDNDIINVGSFNGTAVSDYWHAGNDGSGSGLDADTLDGVEGSGYARAGSTTDDYVWVRRDSTSPALYVTNQSTGAILDLRSGAGNGSTVAIVNNDGSSTWNGRISADSGITSYVNSNTPNTTTGPLFGRNSTQYITLHGGSSGNYLHSYSTDASPLGFYITVKTDSTEYSWTFEDSDGSFTSPGAIYAESGNEVWHAGNDGSGSGLDADTLDSYEASEFPRKAEAATITGAWEFDSNISIAANHYIDHNNTASRDKIRVWNNSNYAIGMDSSVTYGDLNSFAMTFQMNNSSSRGFWWGHSDHTGSEGAMSLTTDGKLTVDDQITVPEIYATTGVFADEVRCRTGQQLVLNAGEASANATGQTDERVYINAEGGLVINSSSDNWATGWAGRYTATICDGSGDSSLPGALSVTGAISANGGVSFDDNDVCSFGTGNDFEIFHDGTHAYMDVNLGNLYVRDGTTTRFTFDDNGDFTATGDVTAYSDASLKDIHHEIDRPGLIDNLVVYDITWKETGRNSITPVAQEVQQEAPELVHEDENGILHMDYGKYAVAALYEEKKKREALEEEVKDLKELVTTLINKLNDEEEESN